VDDEPCGGPPSARLHDAVEGHHHTLVTSGRRAGRRQGRGEHSGDRNGAGSPRSSMRVPGLATMSGRIPGEGAAGAQQGVAGPAGGPGAW